MLLLLLEPSTRPCHAGPDELLDVGLGGSLDNGLPAGLLPPDDELASHDPPSAPLLCCGCCAPFPLLALPLVLSLLPADAAEAFTRIAPSTSAWGARRVCSWRYS